MSAQCKHLADISTLPNVSLRILPFDAGIPLGHPLAATGTRVVLNALYQMKKHPEIRYSLATACAAGGPGGALLIQKHQ